MKNKKMMTALFASMLMLALSFTATNAFAQHKTKATTMKDCCVMKDGKMMCMKGGKMIPMKKDMTMKNGTKCMVNGECIMKNGEKMKMKEGECMDMKGKMDQCDMMNKDTKSTNKVQSEKHNMVATYSCPMHPEITSNKPGKCSKCGMALVKKK